MLILPSEIIAGAAEEETDNSYAIHYCTGSWRDEPSVFFKFWKYIVDLKKIVMKRKDNVPMW
jgi:hypothetical protein